MAVTFKVKLFGVFREVAGNNELTLSLGDGDATVAVIKRCLQDTYPQLALVQMPFVVAVNRKIADDTAAVMATDEIAVLPLVSGG